MRHGKSWLTAILFLALAMLLILPASRAAVPNGPIDLRDGWQFRLDPDGAGLNAGWAQPSPGFQAQRTVSTGVDLASQGVAAYSGVSWYRRTIEAPSGWSRVVLGFGAVDVACELYVNGRFAGQWDDQTLGDWAAVVDLTSMSSAGEPLTLVFRVTGTGGFGGIKQDVKLGQDEAQVMTGQQYLLLLHAAHPDWRLPASGSAGRAWVVSGVEGGSAKAVIGSDGTFSPWAGSYGVSFWLYDPQRRQLVDFPAPTAQLRDGSSPMPIFEFDSGGWRLREELTSSGPPQNPAVTARLTLEVAPNDALLFAGVRPYTASGDTSAINSVKAQAPDVWANGSLALHCADCSVVGGGAIEGLDASALAEVGALPGNQAAQDSGGYAQGLLRAPIALGASLTFVAPSTRVSQAPPAANFDDVSAAWQKRLHAVSLSLPDTNLQNAYYASLGYILVEERSNKIHPGPLIHDNFWVRDAAMIGYALERAGLVDAVRGSAEATLAAIAPDGQVSAIVDSSGTVLARDELDAPGEAAFGLAEYARFSGDAAFLQRAYPAMSAALQQAMSHRDETGLVPPNRSAEDLGAANQHHYWDDLWLLTGLQDASWAAGQLGKSDDAQRWDASAGELRSSLLASAAATGVPFLPNGPEDLDSSAMARGTSPALWPLRVLDPSSAVVRDSFATYYQRFVQPNDGAYRHLYGQWWPYGGLELAHDFLFLGMKREMQQVLDYTLAHQTAPGLYAWAEGVDPVSGGFAEGDMPHGWAAAELVNLVRDTLLYEDGDRLVIGAGVPASWQGKAFSAVGLPTDWGTASLTVAADGTVQLSGVNPPGGVRLALPFPARLG